MGDFSQSGIIQAILALIPGRQESLGELPRPTTGASSLPVIGSGIRALAELIPGTQSFLGETPTLPGYFGGDIAYTWNTGTATFYRLRDGRIAVQKKNGVVKVYRPQKHIVISRNPRVGTLIRADKRFRKLVGGLVTVSRSTKTRAKLRSRRR